MSIENMPTVFSSKSGIALMKLLEEIDLRIKGLQSKIERLEELQTNFSQDLKCKNLPRSQQEDLQRKYQQNEEELNSAYFSLLEEKNRLRHYFPYWKSEGETSGNKKPVSEKVYVPVPQRN